MVKLSAGALAPALVLLLAGSVHAREADSIPVKLDTLKVIPHTPVKDQHRSGTCWSFATVSFLESEILRTSDSITDLSEMYFVRMAYAQKARRYVRYHGNASLSPGGQAHDVTDILKTNGLVPESAYPGLIGDLNGHDHGELDAMVKAMADVSIKKRSGRLTTVWDEAIDAMLDIYLGELPDQFMDKDMGYTPVSFASRYGMKADDYIELTSYSHHSWYQFSELEIPDNWSGASYYNVPLDEFEKLVRAAIERGYSVVWDGDVSEKGFLHKKGVAVNPDIPFEEMNQKEKDALGKFQIQEKKVDQDIRQRSFDLQASTDDHLMHIVGLLKDEQGTVYYLIKNSWGGDSNAFGGYLAMSSSYFRENTVAVMVNRAAIKKELGKNPGL